MCHRTEDLLQRQTAQQTLAMPEAVQGCEKRLNWVRRREGAGGGHPGGARHGGHAAGRGAKRLQRHDQRGLWAGAGPGALRCLQGCHQQVLEQPCGFLLLNGDLLLRAAFL